jgi:hypothetical protein
MTTTYSKTDNYGLNLYGDTDPADLRDGYNGSMRTIDTTLGTHLNRIEAVESRETNDEQVAKALLGDNTVGNATTAKAKWDKAATDATTSGSKADANTAALEALGTETTEKATTAKTKWDKAATDGKQNTAALTALGTDTTAKAAASKAKWDKNTNDITALTTSVGANSTQIATIMEKLSQSQYSDGYLVTFGDSYADGTQSRTWSYQLSTMLPGLTWKNYAKSGAGFNVSNIPTFAQQVANCASDATVDKSKVKVAVCAGGRNDILDYNTAVSKARECVLAMENAFPNAIIVFAPMLFDQATLDEGGMRKYNGLYNGGLDASSGNPRVVLVDSAYVWCKGQSNWFPTGDIHPNDAGAKAIAKYLYTACHDNYRGRQEYAVSMLGSMAVEFKLQNGIIVADGQGQIPSIGGGYGGTLADWCKPRHNIWTWMVTGGHKTQPTLAFIQPDGKWGVFDPVASMQGNASFMASYAA